MISDQFSALRAGLLGLTGATCVLYAGLALVLGRPDPIPVWIPGGLGVASAVLLMMTAVAAPAAAAQATDEGYTHDTRKAASVAYWIALMLYLVFAVPIARGWITWSIAYAVMGCLTGGSYLLLFVWFDRRGRA